MEYQTINADRFIGISSIYNQSKPYKMLLQHSCDNLYLSIVIDTKTSFLFVEPLKKHNSNDNCRILFLNHEI